MTSQMKLRMFSVVAMLSMIACSRASDADYVGRYAGGDDYTGRVEVRVATTGEDGAAQAETGKGSARFTDEGDGRTRLVLKGHIRKADDAGFSAEGVMQDNRWRSREGDLSLVVDADGKISGGGNASPNRLSFRGDVSQDRLDLTIEVKPLEAKASGLVDGATTIFHYVLTRGAGVDGAYARQRPDKSIDRAKTRGKMKCTRTVWQMRNVAAPNGGMTMIQVPVCAN